MSKKLTKIQLKKIKKLFENKREELIAKIYASNKDQELDIDGDDVDVVQGNIISDLNNQISQRDIQTLNRLNYSLDKIAEGTFGVCEECDDPIGEKRLTAIPGCSTCITCAEQEGNNSKQFV